MANQPESPNIFSSEFKEKAFSIYEQLREHDPVHALNLSGGTRGWLITRYQDVQAVFKDSRFQKDLAKIYGWKQEYGMDTGSYISKNMLMTDPPDHTRLRKLVSKAFTPKMIGQMRGDIEKITDSLLTELDTGNPVDLISRFALPLPLTVISNMLGIPVDDRAAFHQWSTKIVSAANDTSKIAQQYGAINAFVSYILKLIERKRQQPDDRLLSLMIEAHDKGDRLTEKELVATIFLLIVAGHETTVNLIGNGTFALLENPQQREKLTKQFETVIRPAVEEMLRFYSPIEMTPVRYAGETIEWKGKKMKKGDPVFLALGSANRDPEMFSSPNHFDLQRAYNPHVAFGKGIHFCLGAPLARLEAEIAFERLLHRFPDFALAVLPEKVKWKEGMMMRSLGSLPVILK